MLTIPAPNRLHGYIQMSGKFLGGEQAGLPKPSISAFQPMLAPECRHVAGLEGQPCIGVPTMCVELVGYLCVSVAIQKTIDLDQGIDRCQPGLGKRRRQRR